MKKVFLALMACATFAFVGCDKNGGNTPTPPPPPPAEDQEEIPVDLSAPDADHMLLVVRVNKDINICNTIAMRGGMTSFGSGDPILFERVPETETWFMATLEAMDNVAFGNSKIMIAGEDNSASYDYEAKGGAYELLEGTDAFLKLGDDFGTENCLNIIEGAEVGGKILYVHVDAFKGNPCVDKSVYKITLKMAYDVEDEYQPGVTGNFNSWSGVIAMDKVSDVEWTVEVEAQPGNEFKFQSTEGDWKNEIQKFDPELETWDKMSNIALGEDMNPVFDFSDPSLYRWAKSVPADPVEDLGEIWIKCAGNGWAWAQMTQGENNVYTYETTVTDAGNVGANIAINAEGASETWYDMGDMSAAAHGLAEGDAYVYTFVKEDGATGTLSVAKK